MSAGDNKPFVPAWLDDAGLTPAQFRVYCHIARRGQCFEALTTMAKCCRIKRQTAQLAIGELLKLGAITKEFRLGRTSVYAPSPRPFGVLGTQPERGTGGQSERGTTHLGRLGYYKGTPSKGTPTKEKGFSDSLSGCSGQKTTKKGEVNSWR